MECCSLPCAAGRGHAAGHAEQRPPGSLAVLLPGRAVAPLHPLRVPAGGDGGGGIHRNGRRFQDQSELQQAFIRDGNSFQGGFPRSAPSVCFNVYTYNNVHVYITPTWFNLAIIYGLSYSELCTVSGAYEPPKAARSVQLRRTAFAFTRI